MHFFNCTVFGFQLKLVVWGLCVYGEEAEPLSNSGPWYSTALSNRISQIHLRITEFPLVDAILLATVAVDQKYDV